MKQFVIDYLANQCGQADRIVGFHRDTDEADLLITLTSGKRIGVCVINRAIRLPEIKERYERNTRQGIYTLYVMDGRMMPPDNSAFEPPYWMAALHTLMNGRIYGYWCEGRDVTIRPFHMEWKWGGSPRTVEYGDEIDLNLLATDVIYPATKYHRRRLFRRQLRRGIVLEEAPVDGRAPVQLLVAQLDLRQSAALDRERRTGMGSLG